MNTTTWVNSSPTKSVTISKRTCAASIMSPRLTPVLALNMVALMSHMKFLVQEKTTTKNIQLKNLTFTDPIICHCCIWMSSSNWGSIRRKTVLPHYNSNGSESAMSIFAVLPTRYVYRGLGCPEVLQDCTSNHDLQSIRGFWWEPES